ncbi:hypothetical protein [Roseateles sp. LKC17W]|uniref:Uncharacterized protein n=1 Tax=Pelomonas margarita TaxID=3299031 RepID=A0ABW7FJZ6_9BURK
MSVILGAIRHVYRAERRAAPKQAHLAMCSRLDAAGIAVPAGDRRGTRALSGA